MLRESPNPNLGGPVIGADRAERARSPLPAVLSLLACLLAGAPPMLGQGGGVGEAAEPDPWAPLRLLEGSWEGAIDGRLGQGTGRRRYESILNGRYLVLRHSSVRLPQEKSPRGDHHGELGIFSFDRERGTIVLREFHVEGFVNRYTCEVGAKRFVCTSESVENGTGMRARLRMEIVDRYRFDEVFELASPGQELKVYFTNRWTRVPDLTDLSGSR